MLAISRSAKCLLVNSEAARNRRLERRRCRGSRKRTRSLLLMAFVLSLPVSKGIKFVPCTRCILTIAFQRYPPPHLIKIPPRSIDSVQNLIRSWELFLTSCKPFYTVNHRVIRLLDCGYFYIFVKFEATKMCTIIIICRNT